MNARAGFLVCALTAVLLLDAQVALAGGECFDFGTPTVNRLLDPDQVQRVVILSEVSGTAAKKAVDALVRARWCWSPTSRPTDRSANEFRFGLCADSLNTVTPTYRRIVSPPA